MDIENNNHFGFDKPTIYEIKVQGQISKSWLVRLGDMKLSIVHEKGIKLISLLVGQVSDQAALSGILNTLDEMHMPVLTVRVLNDIKDQ